MLSDSHFIRIAAIIAEAGTCSRLQVGAVLVKDRRIISTGYNGTPSGMKHCHHDEYSDILQEPPGGYTGCKTAVHAEVNAIAFAAKHGVPTESSKLYTTDSPCVACAQLIVNAGIKEVTYAREYRNSSGINLLQAVGIFPSKVSESFLHPMPVASRNPESMHPSEHADTPFEQGWTEYSATRGRRSPG